MKALKYLVIGVAAVIGLLAIGIAVVAANFDAARVKSELSKVVLEKKQRILKIDGEVTLAFWPSLGVKLGTASLSEHNSEKIFAALDSAQVSVQLLPLLSKRFIINQIELSGIRATLLRDKSGRLNIADLLAPDKEDSGAVQFDIAGTQLANAQLVWRDEVAGQDITLSDLNLRTGHLANTAKGKLDFSGQVLSAHEPKVDAQIKLVAQYDYNLEQKRYAADQLEARITGQVVGVQGLDLMLGAGAIAANLAQAGQAEISVTSLALQARGKQLGDDFELKLAAPMLQLNADKLSGEKLVLNAKLNGSQRNIDVQIDLAGIDGSRQVLRIAKLALTLDAKAGEAALKGKLDSAFTADIPAQKLALEGFSGDFDIAHPQLSMKQLKLPIHGSLRADLAHQSAAGNFTSQFDESKIAAQFTVEKFTPLALGFAVDIDKLNLDKYLPQPAPGGKPAAKSGADDKLDLSALKNLNLHGTLKIGALQIARVKTSNLRLEIRAADGKLDIAPHSANLYDGSVSGALSLNANGNVLTLKENLLGVNIEPLLKDAIDKDMLTGHGNVALDVSTRGATVDAMKQALNGSASLNLKDGAIKGINLAQAFREAKALISAGKDSVQQARSADKTDFSEFTASFKIAGGVAHNEDLAAKSPFLRLAGAGDIDIGKAAIDYLAKASVVNTAGGQGGKDLEALQGLTVPVRVSGPFDKLSYKLEFASMIGEAAKARVAEKKQELQQDLQKKAREQLKGLFGK